MLKTDVATNFPNMRTFGRDGALTGKLRKKHLSAEHGFREEEK